MVEISIDDGILTLDVKGWDKLWSFRSKIDVPLAHIRDARAVTSKEDLKEITRGFGIRAPGTSLPGVIQAGTYYFLRSGRVFMDVHYPIDDVLLIELDDEPFGKLVVDVENSEDVAAMIRGAIKK